MSKFPGIVELGRRGLAVLVGTTAMAFLVGLSVMVYQSPSAPDGAKIAIGVLALVVFAIVLMLLFPRTYLRVDLKSKTATFYERGEERETVPLDEMGPLRVRKITKSIGNSGRRADLSYTFRIESSAFPVTFYEGSTKKHAQRRLKKLNQRFGFTKTAPEKESYEYVSGELQ